MLFPNDSFTSPFHLVSVYGDSLMFLSKIHTDPSSTIVVGLYNTTKGYTPAPAKSSKQASSKYQGWRIKIGHHHPLATSLPVIFRMLSLRMPQMEVAVMVVV